MPVFQKLKNGKYYIIFNFILENRYYFILSFFIGILLSCCTLIIPLFIGKYYQLLNHSNSKRGEIFDAIIHGVNSMELFLILFLLLIFLRFVFQFSQSALNARLNEGFSRFIRQYLFEAQLYSPYAEFEKKPIGNYLMRYSGDMSAITQFLTKGILVFINDLVFIVLTYFIFLSMNCYLTQVIFVTLLIFFSVFFLLHVKLKKQTKRYRDRKSQNLGFVNERLSALFTIKVLNREFAENEKFKKRSEKLYKTGIKYVTYKSLLDSLLPFSNYILLAIILVLSFRLKSSSEEIDGAQLIILIMLIIHLMPVFKRILKVNQIWQTGIISFNRFVEISQHRNIEMTKGSIRSEFKCLLHVNHLSCVNSNGQEVITDFNLQINEPGIYRLKGSNSTGESFFFKILMGIYAFNKGEIKLSDVKFGENKDREIRKKIGYFSNQMDFIGRSIFEMITPNRSKEFQLTVKSTLDFFELHHLSSNEKLNSPIILSELTNNDRNLLSFARLRLSNRSLILLDEPFLNLNEQSISLVLKYLDEMKKDKIILIIDKSNLTKINYANEFEM
jgi:ABC-type multidrug transport system fused ATPase/permease subunit